MKIIKENKGDWIKHNFTHLSRTYPKGFRLGSSNYDPTPFWTAGNQIVALNWQTIGKSSDRNIASFADGKMKDRHSITPSSPIASATFSNPQPSVPRSLKRQNVIESASR